MSHSEIFGRSVGPEKSSRSSIRDIQSRIVALIDMDCFYVQVEQRLAPEWKGKPCAVVQYNEWKGGGIIAVGYEARAMGVQRRGMRGEDAKEVCPDIKLFKVPEVRGKADLTRYREAGAEVIAVLSQFGKCVVERASVDEAYIDMTDEIQDMMSRSPAVTSDQLPNTYVVGTNADDREGSVKEWLEFIRSPDCLDAYNDSRLACAAVLVERMRQAVKEKTGFNCSAGISHNKVLSKLACGLHKPQKQTILGINSVGELFASLPIHKVRHLGGKLGKRLVEEHSIQFMGDICRISKEELLSEYGEKTANFLYDLCRGHDPEPVNSRRLVQSVGCSKNFRGPAVITTYKKARHWVHQLSEEMEERLVKDREQNSRTSKSLSLSVRFCDWQSVTRAIPIPRYSQQAIESAAMAALTKLCGDKIEPGINSLGLSAGKFEDIEGQNLNNYFQKQKGDNSLLVDPFKPMSSPTRQSNPSTPAKPVCNIKSFIDNSTYKSPFDALPASPSRDLGPVTTASNKSTAGCDIKSFVSTAALDDPFEILAKTYPRVCDSETVPNKPLGQPSPAKHIVDMTSFTTSAALVDPFKQLDSFLNPKPHSEKVDTSQTSNIKSYLSNNVSVDPFACLAPSPKKKTVPRQGLMSYFVNTRPKEWKGTEHKLYNPVTCAIDDDILDETDTDVGLLPKRRQSNGANENHVITLANEIDGTQGDTTQPAHVRTLLSDDTCEGNDASTSMLDLSSNNCSRRGQPDGSITPSSVIPMSDCTTKSSLPSSETISPSLKLTIPGATSMSSSCPLIFRYRTTATESPVSPKVSPQKEGEFLDDVIEIWREEGDEERDEYSLNTPEQVPSKSGGEAELSFFEAIEQEQRLFHQLNKSSSQTPTSPSINHWTLCDQSNQSRHSSEDREFSHKSGEMLMSASQKQSRLPVQEDEDISVVWQATRSQPTTSPWKPRKVLSSVYKPKKTAKISGSQSPLQFTIKDFFN